MNIGETPIIVNRRVLVVEDNDINQEIAQEILESIGLNVDIAVNGAEAVELLHQHENNHYALILMDLQMPVMDGHCATRLIREESRYAHIPIIAVTAHSHADERNRCLANGMQDHLTKPIEIPQLFETIQHWLSASLPFHAGH